MGDYEKYLDDVAALLPPPLNLVSNLGGLSKLFNGIMSFLNSLFPTHLPDPPAGLSHKAFIDRRRYDTQGGKGEVIQANQVLYNTETGFPVGRWSYSRQTYDPLLGISAEGAFVFAQKGKSKEYLQGTLNLVMQDSYGVPKPSEGWTSAKLDATKSVAAQMVISHADEMPINPKFKSRILGTGAQRGGTSSSPGTTSQGRGTSTGSGLKISAVAGAAAAAAKLLGWW